VIPEPTETVVTVDTPKVEPPYQPLTDSTFIALALVVSAFGIAGLGLFAFRLYSSSNTEAFPLSQEDQDDIFGAVLGRLQQTQDDTMQRPFRADVEAVYDDLPALSWIPRNQRPVDAQNTLLLRPPETVENEPNSRFDTFGSRFESFAPYPEELHDFDEATLDRPFIANHVDE
jgi:hypothetical protein